MSKEWIKTSLFCLTCSEESTHIIEYVNNRISSISCEECGKSIVLHKEICIENFPENLLHRFFTKPSRLTDEMHNDLNTFLRSIPSRVITKPIRLAKEISHLSKE
jgi:hypothetical protein